MEDIKIHETTKSPEILFSPNGEISISGRSFLENTKEFYEPLIKWLTEYIKNPAEKTTITFNLEYFNTSSQLWIFRMVEILLDLVKLNKDVEFFWHYSEEEIKEVGIDLANLLGIKMNFIEEK